MKTTTLTPPLLAAVLALVSCPWCVSHADATIVGLNRMPCPPKSDTLVSAPFMKLPLKASGSLAAAPAVANGQAILTPSKAGWQAGELAGTSYVRFTSGELAGHWYDIVGNTGTSLTIDLNGESGAGLAKDDEFVIAEYWTLDTLFPPGTQKTIHVSEGTQVYRQNSKVLVPDTGADGSDLAAAAVYFLTEGGWKKSAPGHPDAGGTILPPGQPFTIRHPAGVEATEFVPFGEVLPTRDAIWVAQSASGPQDNQVAVFRPVDVPLEDAGLDSVIETSQSHDDRKDELLVFDNAVEGFNKKPSTIFYKLADGWIREDDETSGEAGDAALEASGGVILRKAQGVSDSSTLWINEPNY